MSEKPISPLRQRMLEDTSERGFTPDTQRDYIRANFQSMMTSGSSGPSRYRHRYCGSSCDQSSVICFCTGGKSTTFAFTPWYTMSSTLSLIWKYRS